MAWARLDDDFHLHRKVRRAGNEAAGVFARGLSYCQKYGTDGHLGALDDDFLTIVLPEAQNRLEVAERLVSVGLLEARDDGYWVHDYLDYNDSAEQIRERRAKQSAGGKKSSKRFGYGKETDKPTPDSTRSSTPESTPEETDKSGKGLGLRAWGAVKGEVVPEAPATSPELCKGCDAELDKLDIGGRCQSCHEAAFAGVGR